MATQTKLELLQINSRLATENTDLRARVSQLEADILRITECASVINKVKAPRPAYTPPQWQIDRAEQMAKAKALAMATGKSVCI